MAVLNNNRSHPSVHSEGVRDKSVYGTKKFWRFLNSGINSVNKKKGLKKFMDQHKRNQKIVSLRNQGMTSRFRGNAHIKFFYAGILTGVIPPYPLQITRRMIDFFQILVSKREE